MKKTVQIVITPLSSREGFHQKGDLIKLINLIKNNDKYKLGDLTITPVKWDAVEPNVTWQSQQLLVLSDDEIKTNTIPVNNPLNGNGDLAYNSIYKKVFKMVGDVTNFDFKVIASYPNIEGTLPISKETVQAWIDAGTPEEGIVKLVEGHYIPSTYDQPDNWVQFDVPRPVTISSNILLEFNKKYKNRGNDLGDLAERAIDKIIANATTKPSIPTYEKINDIASDYAVEKCRIMKNMKCLTARKTAYIDGYKQALKDLGYE
jgi:hypothetical protein